MIHPEWASITRAAIVNLDNNQLRRFFMNPNEVQSQIDITWNKQAGLGASYERLHYHHTNNAVFSLTVHYNQIVMVDQEREPEFKMTEGDFKDWRDSFEGHRRFLMALAYPRGRTNDQLRRSPPSALLVWPRFLAIECVLTSLQFRDNQFAKDGSPVAFVATCQFEEKRNHRLTSDEIRRVGFIRDERDWSGTFG